MSFERVEIGPCILYRGRCEDVLPTLASGSVDAVVTDPPYPKEFNHCWGVLAIQAERLLADRRHLVTLLGHYQIPFVINAFGKTKLRYWWICCLSQHARVRLLGKGVSVYWKPALWYIKGKRRIDLPDVPVDRIAPTQPDKLLHPWEQPLGWFKHYIERLTLSNEVVLDPFLGSGTAAVAAVQLGRHGIGVEVDPRYFDIACRRVEAAVKDQRDSLFPAAMAKVEQPDLFAEAIP